MHETKTTACGTEIKDKSIFVIFRGLKIYLCEQECIEEFQENPDKFITSDHLKITLPIL
ncbi:MAG: hypothetical protein INQ03_13435 [Candidatus Heimdallarchaeota archaeon]|nr:hypothetical protein [Candidatus Heimdallarchaeota archaeon]